MSAAVEVSRSESVVEVVIDRPEKRNALTTDMYAALADALAAAETDATVNAVLISGTGAGFCAGNDLRDFVDTPFDGEQSAVARFLRTISTLTVPVVAAVHGAAVGVGATMLLHCDFVVADETAKLSFPFVGLGLVPEAASSLLLPLALGQLQAARLLLLGEVVPAERALQLGLVTEVVPAGGHLIRGRQLAADLAAKPPEAMRLTKSLLRSPSTGVAERMTEEMALFGARLESNEFAAAVAKYLR